MSEVEKFEAWRTRTLKEHENDSAWQKEVPAFFLDLYQQTYPARRFPLMLELYEQQASWTFALANEMLRSAALMARVNAAEGP